MDFVHLQFIGETTSPWSISRRIYSNFIYCQKFLWGRGVRGVVLNYLLRTYCPHFPAKELPCNNCNEREECAFHNLYGSEKDDELKDTPKLTVTSLIFDKPSFKRLSLTSKDTITNGIAQGPVSIEYIPSRTRFEFEVILTGKGVNFADRFEEAVRATLSLIGWGGRCSRGYGKGRILEIHRHNFDGWVTNYVDKRSEMFKGVKTISLEIFPILILEKNGDTYESVIEEGFRRKLRNSMVERYWQFFKSNAQLDLEDVSGPCALTTFRAWSKKENGEKTFEGLTGTLKFRFASALNGDSLRIVGVSWYGIGRFKNQGFGSLRAS